MTSDYEAGYAAAREQAALLPRKWKHESNIREQIGRVDDEAIAAVQWIATVIEGEIRAMRPKSERVGNLAEVHALPAPSTGVEPAPLNPQGWRPCDACNEVGPLTVEPSSGMRFCRTCAPSKGAAARCKHVVGPPIGENGSTCERCGVHLRRVRGYEWEVVAPPAPAPPPPTRETQDAPAHAVAAALANDAYNISANCQAPRETDVEALVREGRAVLARMTPGEWRACGAQRKDGPCLCGQVNGEHHPIAKVEIGEWGDLFDAIRLVDGQTGEPCAPGTIGAKAESFMDFIPYGTVPKTEALANADGIAWLRNNASRLLDALARPAPVEADTSEAVAAAIGYAEPTPPTHPETTTPANTREGA